MINLSKEKPEQATGGGGNKGKPKAKPKPDAKKRMLELTAWGGEEGDEQGEDDAQTKKEEGDDEGLPKKKATRSAKIELVPGEDLKKKHQ